MGQRFYFDLTNGQDFVRDDEVVEASSPDEAIKEARAALKEMRGGDGTKMPGNSW